jgi:hypothetical protein
MGYGAAVAPPPDRKSAMTPSHRTSLRRRAIATRAVSAASIGFVLAAIVPAVADAARIGPELQDQADNSPGTDPAVVLIEGGVLSIRNPASNKQYISEWDANVETISMDADPLGQAQSQGVSCGSSPPQQSQTDYGDGSLGYIGCGSPGDGTARGLIEPGGTQRFQINVNGNGGAGGLSDEDLAGQLSNFTVTWVDANCVNGGSARLAARIFAAKLDECDREALGVPRLLASRIGGNKLALLIKGAPPGWSTRLFGADARRKLKNARSGKTLAKLKPVPGAYRRFGRGILKAGPKIKFVREAWTKKGERAILSPVVRVKK